MRRLIIARKHNNINFSCVDISKIQIEAGHKYVQSQGLGDRFEFMVGDVCAPIPTSYHGFDYVICTEIIEHLRAPERLLQNVRNYGKGVTSYIFSVPIGQSTNNICYRVIQEDGGSVVINDPGKLDLNKKYYEFYHKSYSIDEATKLLSDNGYEIRKITGAHFLPNSSLGYYINRLTRYSYKFDKIINKLTRNHFIGDAIFLCVTK